MGIASGTRVKIGYVAEVTRGVTPATPTLKTLRSTSRNINLKKNVLDSNEVRSDRQIADSRHGVIRVEGTVGCELGVGSYDDMIEAALGGAWATVSISSTTTLALNASTATLTRGSGSFVTDNVYPGDVVQTQGFTNPANNGFFTVLAVTASALTLYPGSATLVTESASGTPTVTVAGKRVAIGTNLKTFTFERQFTDIAQYQAFPGVTVNQMDVSIKPEQMVTASFGLLGIGSPTPLSGTSISGSAPSAAPTNSPFSAFDGSMVENGAVIAVITGIDFSIKNNRQLGAVVGSKVSPDVFEGRSMIDGTITAYFKDATLVNKFINETTSSANVRLADLNGTDFHSITFPRIKYNGGDMDPGQEGPVIVSLPVKAIVDPVTGLQMYYQRSNAS